eukprot:5047531-Prymnesium_polylepis.1
MVIRPLRGTDHRRSRGPRAISSLRREGLASQTSTPQNAQDPISISDRACPLQPWNAQTGELRWAR